MHDGQGARDPTRSTSALLKGLVHDLRNTLFALSANLEALELDPGDPAELQETCRVLRAEHDRLATLTGELAELGHPGPPELKAAPLRTVLHRAAAGVAPLAESRGVEVEVEAAETWTVPMEPRGLELAVGRLLAAACRQAPRGGRVRVAVEAVEQDGRSEVRIAVGAPADGEAETFPGAFEPYSDWSARGDRLGLAIARHVAEEHGGRVTASRGSGGPRLCLELPAG